MAWPFLVRCRNRRNLGHAEGSCHQYWRHAGDECAEGTENADPHKVVRVSTAPNYLAVIELAEPVREVAAGSSSNKMRQSVSRLPRLRVTRFLPPHGVAFWLKAI
jgi:hypothetical protein